MRFSGRTKPTQSFLYCVLVLGSMVFAGGCMPMMVYTFYEPSAQTGIVERAACRGNAGPRTTIRFQWDDLELSMYGKKKGDKDLLIVITVTPSPETVLRFLTQDFKITIDGKLSHYRPIEVIGYLWPDAINGVAQGHGESVVLSQWQNLTGREYDTYWVSLSLPIGAPTNFELQFPPIEMNQQPIQIPPITFTQTTESFFIEPINC